MDRDGFLFTSPGGVRYRYRRGEGILAALPGPDAQDEFEVFLWGTVFGAVAWLNGFFPLHASAVVVDGRAMAFTADSGGGKSTLATALSARGLPHLCDDTLALAAREDAIWAIPDGKPVKLWGTALALTGAEAKRPISMIPGKFFTSAPVPALDAAPLSDLFVLETGPSVRLEPLRGPEVLAVLAEAMYRPYIAIALGDRAAHGEWLLSLAGGIRVWRLQRPWQPGDSAAFGDTADAVVAALRTLG